MRLLRLLGFTVALVIGVSAASAVASRPVPVGVAFWDAQHGLAALTAFTSCRGFPPAERVVLERTADGGRTWKRVRSACASVTAFGGSVTLATTGRGGAMLAIPGGLLRTTDSGRSWSTLHAPRIVALSFVSSSLGWAVVGGPQHLSLRQTRDGGRTWRALTRPCDGEFGKVSFVEPRHGWVLCTGGAGAGNQSKEVYETGDAGATWWLRARTPYGSRPVGKLDTYGYPTDVAFRSDGHGWMAQLRGATLTTRDGGRTWTPVGITVPEERIGVAVSFLSDTTGFILVQDEVKRVYQLERSNDGARTWRVAHAWRY